MVDKVIVENRQARHIYHLEPGTYKAGLCLEGWEVKAIRAGRATFNGGNAFIRFKNGEAWLEAMTITPALDANMGLLAPRDPARARKLLLNKEELKKLQKRISEQGYTVVPLRITQGRLMKLDIALAKGKKLHDKRESIKQRDLARAQARELVCRYP